MTPIAPTLQAFFTDRLTKQLHASPRTIASYRDGRVAGSIAAPGSHGSRRDSHPSPGSSHRPSVAADQAPVGEQAGLPYQQSRPPSVQALGAPQSPILLGSPAPQVGADAL
jgi:hypothetical protein